MDPVTGARITDLPAAQNIVGTDVLVGVNDSATRKFSLTSILTWLKSQLTPSDIDAQAEIKSGSLTLSATWSGSGPYTQSVSITGATASSRVDLQPTAAQIATLQEDGVTALTVENNNGALTVYALGAAPSATMTVQYTMTEVSS